ncbi:hypothetical protein KC963_02155 [Candidatus Saccharibacteria bacterium]|nr:hypothetical protein [Candidatus Saccharibacteria bacterium]MCA9337194.1 hypothetical protein [Candidatus Saccharibacteria bacterium]
MSERLPITENRHEREPSHEQNEKQAERLREMHEKAEKSPDNKEHVPELEKAAKHEAISGKERPTSELGKEKRTDNTPLIDRTVKKTAYKRELHRIQQHLSKPERSFSKLIHKPTVEAISNVGAKTVARPSGVLGSSIAALAGGMFVVWISRHYGFRYNFFVFIALLGVGFAVGLLAELLFKTFRKAFKRA